MEQLPIEPNKPSIPGTPRSKIDEYVDRVKAGETVESFGEIPESWKTQILEKVGDSSRGEAKKKDEDRIKALRQELGIIPVEEPTVESAIASIEEKMRTDLESLTVPEIKEQIKLAHDLQYWKRRGSLSDDLFSVGRGHMYESEDGNVRTWEPVRGEIGKQFDAHGISKTEQLGNLLALLDSGIDSTRQFYSAPFELPAEDKAGMGAGVGTGDGTAYKDGLAVVTSRFGGTLVKDGIKHVFLNDVYQNMKGLLSKAYPNYEFHLLSEQKEVLEAEASEHQ